MRVALYARVSTSDQNCELQLSDLRRMSESREFEIVGEYVDNGISGAKDNRPELNRLMKDARRGQFKAVLVWRFDRFARSLKHLVMALEEFRSLGIEFLSHQEAVDTSTPVGRMLFQVIGAMAEFEREIIRERVIAGLRQAKKKGKKLGRPRVRFDVEMARRLRGEGLSYKVVAKRLGISVGAIHEVLTKS
jgi:DNA invertase Pin-like site-specific DNA recombinase